MSPLFAVDGADRAAPFSPLFDVEIIGQSFNSIKTHTVGALRTSALCRGIYFLALCFAICFLPYFENPASERAIAIACFRAESRVLRKKLAKHLLDDPASEGLEWAWIRATGANGSSPSPRHPTKTPLKAQSIRLTYLSSPLIGGTRWTGLRDRPSGSPSALWWTWRRRMSVHLWTHVCSLMHTYRYLELTGRCIPQKPHGVVDRF